MNYNLSQPTTKTARVRSRFVAVLVLACAFATVTRAAAQVTPPPVPDSIAVPAGNAPYLVGHAFGTQGYICLPTSSGGTSWEILGARPEATLFGDFFGQQFQIITHFQSPDLNPNSIAPNPLPLGGNATWQSSLDSSRVWAVKKNGIDAGSDPASCPNTGAIQCLLLQSIGNLRGPTGGQLLAKATFIQRLNTRGGSAPTTACSVGQTQLVPYTADYYFFREVE